MSQPLQLAINGASGRMGQSLLQVLRDDTRFALQQALVSKQSSVLEKSLAAPYQAVTYAAAWHADTTAELDVAIDFSSPAASMQALAVCREHGVPLVLGTTGLDATMQAQVIEASETIPVLQAANFSIGITVLENLLREAAHALANWDLEIVETHHGNKQDAPSGTALALGQAAAKGRMVELDEKGVFVRHGHTGARTPGDIGFATIRGGDVVGEHTALLLAQGERLELTHRATDRLIFARGALTAAAWLSRATPGLYDMHDVVGL